MDGQKIYDVVIVGAGISGAIAAFKLAQAGKTVLILDGGAEVPPNRNDYMEKFYLSLAKTPESPYPDDPDNPRPLVLDINLDNPPQGYFVEKGPLPFASTYERVAGGTTWHWMGTSLRLLPNDFCTQSKYGHGVDWAYDYDELEPWYGRAEWEIGIAADVQDQEYHGLTFTNPFDPSEPYNYPMPGIPQSYLDQQLSQAIGGDFVLEGQNITVTQTPQARNSIPFDDRRVCAGNTNCIPICPIQAKYDATVHIAKAQNLGVDVLYKTVVYSLSVDSTSGLISGVNYKQYEDPNGPATNSGSVSAKLYIMAAHAIETPKILLNSATNELPNGVANSSGQVGKNLMDHPVQLSWALMPTALYPFRGPLSTSGVENLRDGDFRKIHAAFRMEIGNEGWNWANNDPWNSVCQFVNEGQFGTALKSNLNELFIKQFRFGSLVEQMPLETNRIVPSTEYFDNLGIPRPEIHYDLDPYTRAGFAAAQDAAEALFAKMNAADKTAPVQLEGNPTAFTYEGKVYNLNGAGHVMGTYRMGTDSGKFVLDPNQQSYDHSNLFMVGSGVFPAVGTANPTLTIVATTLKTVDNIIKNVLK